LNECNSDDEYRCASGMCIDEEYFLDGDIDCQDKSDEQLFLDLVSDKNCSWINYFDCDELIIPGKTLFSCGDGEMTLMNYFLLQTTDSRAFACYSFREKQWMCELDRLEVMWTNPRNGHCLDFVDDTTDMEEENDICVFYLKCSFTLLHQHYKCPCSGNGCKTYLSIYCGSGKGFVIRYPNGAIFTPFVLNLFLFNQYDYDQDRRPTGFKFHRSIKCNGGIRVMPNEFDNYFYREITALIAESTFSPFEMFLCGVYTPTSPASELSKNENCWNDSYPNQAIDCLETNHLVVFQNIKSKILYQIA
jgi:hypothetical protein